MSKQHDKRQTLTQNNVGGRDTHVLEVHFEVATVDSI